MILSHKKPSSVSELLGNSDAFLAAKEWAEQWQNGKKMPPLLVCGPTGTGKTALAYALASQFSWELFEFNASDFRDVENVEKVLSNAATAGGLFGSRRLILIDDVDSLSGSGDRGGAGAIAKVLASSQQPIILTALDYYDKKISTIRTHCQRLELRKVHSASIGKLIRGLAHAGKMELTDEQVDKIASSAGGDVRAALNDLQGRNPYATRDSQQNIFEVLRVILKSSKYSEARKSAFSSELEHDTLKLWVAHNLPIEYEKPFDLAEGYNMLSRADIFDGRIRRNQHYGYLRYSNDLLSAGVAVSKTAPYHKYSPFAFPDYLREMGASKGSRAMRKGVLRKIAGVCHCSLQQAQHYLALIEALAKKYPKEISDEFGFEEEELSFVAKTPVKKVKKEKEGKTIAVKKTTGRKKKEAKQDVA